LMAFFSAIPGNQDLDIIIMPCPEHETATGDY